MAIINIHDVRWTYLQRTAELVLGKRQAGQSVNGTAIKHLASCLSGDEAFGNRMSVVSQIGKLETSKLEKLVKAKDEATFKEIMWPPEQLNMFK